MSKSGATAAKGSTPKRRLRAATLVTLVANAIPLLGVAFWGWDAFLLLMLYWMETVIVAVRTILQVAVSGDGGLSRSFPSPGRTQNGGPGTRHPLGRIRLALFFTVHAGMFIGIHFLFLWSLFSGDWPQRTGGVLPFFHTALFAEGLWVPLLVMAVAQAFQLLDGPLKNLLSRRQGGWTRPAQPAASHGEIVSGLYLRIVVMQLTIILGAWIALALGSTGPLILLIAAKIVIEIRWLRRSDVLQALKDKAQKEPSAALLRDGRPNWRVSEEG